MSSNLFRWSLLLSIFNDTMMISFGRNKVSFPWVGVPALCREILPFEPGSTFFLMAQTSKLHTFSTVILYTLIFQMSILFVEQLV